MLPLLIAILYPSDGNDTKIEPPKWIGVVLIVALVILVLVFIWFVYNVIRFNFL